MTKNADQMQESRNEMMIVRVDLGMLHYCPVAPGIAFSLLLSASVVMGHAVYEGRPLGGSLFLSIAVFIAGAIAVFVVFQLAAQALTRWNSHDLRREISRSLPPWFWLAAWAIILACWIPCLLAYWPGVFAYDLPKQTAQVFTGDYNTDHPILHTLLWNACLQVASLIGMEAVTLYAIIQMAFLSFAFAMVVRFFQQRNLPLWLIALSLVFFALHPANALMAISPTKDVPLAAFFVLFTLEIVRLSSSPSSYLSKRKNIVRIVLFGLACCLFRNNMPYALLLAAVVAFAFARGFRLRMLAIFAVPAIVAILFAGPILGSMGITHVRNWEAFSVPMQQVAYAAEKHDVDIDQSLKDRIDAHLPYDKMLKRFNPRFADPVKRLFVSDDKAGFLSIWLDLGLTYPKDYFKEFLNLNIPYWYLPASNIDPYSQRDYIEMEICKSEYYSFERTEGFPMLHAWYDAAAQDKLGSRAWPLAPFFSISLPIWLLLACCCTLVATGRKRGALFCIVAIAFWVTFLFGPVSNFRYVFPLLCIYPIAIASVLRPRELFDSEL